MIMLWIMAVIAFIGLIVTYELRCRYLQGALRRAWADADRYRTAWISTMTDEGGEEDHD